MGSTAISVHRSVVSKASRPDGPIFFGSYKWRRCFRKDPEMVAKQIVNGNFKNTWRSIRTLGSPFRDTFMNPLKF